MYSSDKYLMNCEFLGFKNDFITIFKRIFVIFAGILEVIFVFCTDNYYQAVNICQIDAFFIELWLDAISLKNGQSN